MILSVLVGTVAILAVLALALVAAATVYDYLNRPRWRSSYHYDKETPPRGWRQP